MEQWKEMSAAGAPVPHEEAVPPLTRVEAGQQGYRWVAITAMLYAIGIILHTVSPNVGGVTINWTIAMYCIVIN